MCILKQKKYKKKYNIRIFQNKEHMISYYQIKKNEKNKDAQNQAEIHQNQQKLVKNWYFVHFEKKKNIKIIKMKVI